MFISSRQTPDLVELRSSVAEALRRLTMIPWIFEETPPAPYPPEVIFVPAVRGCHVFIWLVSDTVSPAVAREVHTAVETSRPSFVVRLSNDQAVEAEDLLQRIREHATSVDAPRASAVPELIARAVAVDLVRRYAGEPAPSRAAQLRLRALQSRERSVARWETAGLAPELAIALVDDLAVGRDFLDLIIPGRALVLVGGIGSGKSLALERTFRSALRAALSDYTAPIPVLLHAAELSEGLEASVRRQCTGLGDPSAVGVRILVDGANEPGPLTPGELLLQARTLARAWRDTSVLIAAQPFEAFTSYPDVTEISLLSDSEATALVNQVSGSEIDLADLDERVRESIRYPLFALLYALWRLRESRALFATRTDLIRWLASRTVAARSDAAAQLERLAVLMLEQDGRVRPEDLGTLDQQRVLLESGLVRIGPKGEFHFGLPVLLEWFAAQSLLRDGAAWDPLLRGDAVRRRDTWQPAAMLALATADAPSFRRVAAGLIRVDPGFAAAVLASALDASDDSYDASEDAATYGADLQAARTAWLQGLGPLGPAVITTDGAAPVAIATRMDRGLLKVLEARVGSAAPGAVMAAPVDADPWKWPRSLQTVPLRRLWSWQHQLKEVQRDIARICERRSLFVPSCPPQQAEAAWAAARTLMTRDPLGTSISLDRIEEALGDRTGSIRIRSGPDLSIPVRLLRDEVARIRAVGGDALVEPWPGLDGPLGGWVWSGYSDERLLQRAHEVFTAAVTIYAALIEVWFVAFAPRLWHYGMFPARLVGTITPADETQGFQGGPAYSLAVVPLPSARASRVEFTLRPRSAGVPTLEQLLEPPRSVDVFEHLVRAVSDNRPGRDLALRYTSSGGLEIFGAMPANELAWSWLSADLEVLGIRGGGHFPRPI